MMSWISSLYKNPTAQLRINGSLSETVRISNGTRQGRPLSPLLFNITLEPFIRRIMANDTIQGFKVKGKDYKVAAYANDLLFFVTKPHATLPALMKEFSLYGSLSNLKTNYSKSEAMNLSVPAEDIDDIKSKCPFQWADSSLKYLGIWVTPKLYGCWKPGTYCGTPITLANVYFPNRSHLTFCKCIVN